MNKSAQSVISDFVNCLFLVKHEKPVFWLARLQQHTMNKPSKTLPEIGDILLPRINGIRLHAKAH